MNMLEGVVTLDGLSLLGGSRRLAMPRAGLPVGTEVAVGIRPEAVRLVAQGTPGALDATVDLVEELGAGRVIYVDLDGAPFSVMTSEAVHPEPGTAVGLQFSPDDMHFFSSQERSPARCLQGFGAGTGALIARRAHAFRRSTCAFPDTVSRTISPTIGASMPGLRRINGVLPIAAASGGSALLRRRTAIVHVEPANSDSVTSPNGMSEVPDMPSREVRFSPICSGRSMMRATSRCSIRVDGDAAERRVGEAVRDLRRQDDGIAEELGDHPVASA